MNQSVMVYTYCLKYSELELLDLEILMAVLESHFAFYMKSSGPGVANDEVFRFHFFSGVGQWRGVVIFILDMLCRPE